MAYKVKTKFINENLAKIEKFLKEVPDIAKFKKAKVCMENYLDHFLQHGHLLANQTAVISKLYDRFLDGKYSADYAKPAKEKAMKPEKKAKAKPSPVVLYEKQENSALEEILFVLKDIRTILLQPSQKIEVQEKKVDRRPDMKQIIAEILSDGAIWSFVGVQEELIKRHGINVQKATVSGHLSDMQKVPKFNLERLSAGVYRTKKDSA